MTKKSILIVEDESIIAMELEARVEDFGYISLGSASSAEEALAIIECKRPSVVLLDINIEGEINGLELAQKIRELYSLPFIFLSAYNNESHIQRATELGAVAFLNKPFLDEELQSAIESALAC